MADTRVNSATLMHPQERNVHNKVFGGCVPCPFSALRLSTLCELELTIRPLPSLADLLSRRPPPLSPSS